MNKLVLIFSAFLFAGQAIATGDHGKPTPQPGGGNSAANSASISGSASSAKAESRASATATSASRSKSSAKGGNASAAGGQGGQGGSSYANIEPMSFTFTTPAVGPSFVNHDYSGIPRQAPAMGNSYINTSNGCDGAQGLGFVFPGGGVNFSSTALRMMCEGRLNSQAHKALGDEEKARRVMRVVDEYACTQDATWAKIAREEGICKPDTAPPSTSTNPAFQSN